MEHAKKTVVSTYGPIILIASLLVVGGIAVVVSDKKAQDAATAPVTVLDQTIVKLEAAVKNNPDYVQSYIDLSNAYLQKSRETADAAYYEKIDRLMDSAEKIEPENAAIPGTRASVAMGRHNFVDGLKYAQEAVAKNGQSDLYYGLLGDAEIELGNYDEAVAAFQKMVDIRPGFGSYSRIAYARELYGDIAGAKAALHLAIDSGSNFKENIAWAYVELGKLDMRNNLDLAEKDFQDALRILPEYSQALEGLGKVAFAKGDSVAAIQRLTLALNILPLAQYSTDLADVYGSIGDTVKRDQYITLTQQAYASAASSGVDVDLEQALFLADHDLQLDVALEQARKAYAVRPNQYAADYLAWALYKNNKFEDAAQYQKQALQLGEFDPMILFHQGMIALKNNDKGTAARYLKKAYALNPYFSIQHSAELKAAVK